MGPHHQASNSKIDEHKPEDMHEHIAASENFRPAPERRNCDRGDR